MTDADHGAMAREIPPPRSLADLKAEVLRRAESQVYPLIGLDVDDVREALIHINSLDRDEWADAWIAVGDRYSEIGERLAHCSKDEADRNFLRAWRLYGFGRWPVPNAARKEAAYAKSLAAFARHLDLARPEVEVLRLPFQEGTVIAYLHLPARRPAPIVVVISGLDSRKEELAERCDPLVAAGIGYVAVDSPGTGQAPVKASATAERMYSCLLDHLFARKDVDSQRVAIFGGSFGGYWALKLAITERSRLKGAVVQSPGVHTTFQPDHLRRALGNREYLFDLVPAMLTTFDGVSDLSGLAKARSELSLLDQGLLSEPAAPMLVIAGVRDSQTPFEDIELLLRSGTTPKEAWINPVGGHMGRDASLWKDPVIFKRITMPWLVRLLDQDAT